MATQSPTDRLTAAADRLEITEVLYRYAIALDARNWPLLETVFTEDAAADFLEFGGVHEGRDAMTAFVAGALEGLDATQHLIGCPLVTLDGDTATSVCYLQAQHVFVGAPGGDHFLVGGSYEDRLVRTPDGWRIVHRTLHGTWTDGNPDVFSAGAERLAAAKG